MSNLYVVILIIFSFSLILNYLSNYSNKNAIETVNDMGLGYNLGKTFNYFNSLENEYLENYEIKIWGTILPSKNMIFKIRNYGFKTIRLQVVSIDSANELGIVTSEWISRIKEIIKWIIDYNMYCILSVYFDGKFWQKKNFKIKYINFWIQISKEFIDFDDHLVFESSNGIDLGFIYNYDDENNNKEEYYSDFEKYYMNLMNLTESFIYIFRNSGRNNLNRLLIISEFNTEIEIFYNNYLFKSDIPKDPSNKLAISLNYYFPLEFNTNIEKVDMEWYGKYGIVYSAISIDSWGSYNDYKEIMKNFDFLKKTYINNGVPVIIGEVLQKKAKI